MTKARIRQIALIVFATTGPTGLAGALGTLPLPSWANITLGSVSAVAAFLAKSPLME